VNRTGEENEAVALPFTRLPFSRYGSWFALSLGRDHSPLIRELHGGDYAAPYLFRLRFAGHEPEDLIYTMEAEELTVGSRTAADCRLGVVCGARNDLYIRCVGFRVSLEAQPARYNSLVPLDTGDYEYQCYATNRKIGLRGRGAVEFRSRWDVRESRDVAVVLDGGAEPAELALRSYRVTPEQEFSSYEAEKAGAGNCFAQWIAPFGGDEGGVYRKTAQYVLWGNFVRRDGVLGYDALYMNKGSMTNIWSWDNCFSAIALARTHPQSALEQLLIILDHQDESGALPDYANDLFASYSCVKPPIYGWTIQKLRERNDFFRERELTARMYEKISRLTRFWLERRLIRDWGLCGYWHGNDSGWDNASVFHRGTPLCAPDLAAYLIRQMDALAELAGELGRTEEEARWKARAEEMFTALMRRLHTPDGFVSRLTRTGEADGNALCLINQLPLLIHYRMDRAVVDALVKRLEEFEGNYGLFTERRDSPHYRKGGYWLGPVWAPVTLLFVDALYTAGYTGAAARLAAKFRRLPSAGLMAENFDPDTGEGFDDNAFAWTAGVYFVLEEYEKSGTG
jgi:glycogen debranching enzyme